MKYFNKQDYYPFGMLMPGRNFNTTGFRFGFNGKEKTDELYGTGNAYDYGMRMYDPRLGRFLSIDPLAKKFPFYSPYMFAGDKPIRAVDLDGQEEYNRTTYLNSSNQPIKTVITIINNIENTNKCFGTGIIVHNSVVSYDTKGNATIRYTGDDHSLTKTENDELNETFPTIGHVDKNGNFVKGKPMVEKNGDKAIWAQVGDQNTETGYVLLVKTKKGERFHKSGPIYNSITVTTNGEGGAAAPDPKTSANVDNYANDTPKNYVNLKETSTNQSEGRSGTSYDDQNHQGGNQATTTTDTNGKTVTHAATGN